MTRSRHGAALRRRGLRGLTTALLVSALAGVVAAGPGVAPASAQPGLPDARRAAQELRTQVDALQVQAELAVEAYDESQGQLADLAVREGMARRQLDQARQATEATSDAVAERARALYMGGGRAGLMATLLGSDDIGEAIDRYQVLRTAYQVDVADQDRAEQAYRQARQISDAIARLADERSQLERQAQDRADKVTALLDQSQALLAAADDQVRRLAEAERVAAEQRAAALARARFAQLGLVQGTTPGAGATTTTVGAAAPSPTGAPNPQAAAAIAAATAMLGRPYVWGGTGPDVFDCSGLTGWAYRQAGVSLPRTSRQQWYAGRHVELGQLEPGDLLFWAVDVGDPATIHHVGMYVGDGQMIDAPRPGLVVRVEPVYTNGLIGVVRPVG